MSTDLRARLGARLRDPIFYNELMQLTKTVIAALAAWIIAKELLTLPQPFLAPWSALLVVHATVYRTFARGAQQVAANVAGVLLAAGVGHLIGLDSTALGILLVLGLVLGALPWLGAEGTTLVTTALVVLTTGLGDHLLISRLLDTAIGVAVGLVVNLAVWPPLRRRTAVAALDAIDNRIGDLLGDIADGLEDGCEADEVTAWIDRSRDIDADLDHAASLVRQARESARMNPRPSARHLRNPEEWHSLMRRMEQAIAELRSMARTLGHRVDEWQEWDDGFTHEWRAVLSDTARAVSDADPAALHAAGERLDRLIEELAQHSRTSREWPVQGALVTNLHNLIDAMEDVTAANPMGNPPLPVVARLQPLAGRRTT